jgi:hypothetical protein
MAASRVRPPPPLASSTAAGTPGPLVGPRPVRRFRPLQPPPWLHICAPVTSVSTVAGVAPSGPRLPPVSARLEGRRLDAGAPSASPPKGTSETPKGDPVDAAAVWIDRHLHPGLPRTLTFEFMGISVELSDRIQGTMPLREVRVGAKGVSKETQPVLTALLRRLFPPSAPVRKVDSGHPSTLLFMGPIPSGPLATSALRIPAPTG